VSGIGGGGQLDTSVSSEANTALYSCFAGVSFFAGTIHNKLGTKLTLFMGACGYSLYIASFLCYNHTQNEGFVVASGAILGVCASMFWTAQGAVMLSYPLEKDKG
jgi:MFS family permease